MPRAKSLAWTAPEIAVLHEFYPAGGINAVTDLLPNRSWTAIYVMANRLQLRAPPTMAPRARLQGEQLEEAIRLREQEKWPFSKIGARFGVSESSASNAVLIALCPRKGYRPAERTEKGRLTEAGKERLRYALRKGMKPVEIQLRLGISAERIAEERRRYNAELKARGKALLPPPGGGEAYAGAKLPRARRATVEALFLEGYGTQKISERTGVSHSSIIRIRAALVRRLRRKGQCLPGCDIDGNRHVAKESTNFVPMASIAELKRRILAREPVNRAARELCIGGSVAYRIRDQLAAELAARGEVLPRPITYGRSPHARQLARDANWLPKGYLAHYRTLIGPYGHEEAKRRTIAKAAEDRAAAAEAAREEARRPKTFEEQLALVASGKARIVANIPLRRPDPTGTLGGVATGAL